MQLYHDLCILNIFVYICLFRAIHPDYQNTYDLVITKCEALLPFVEQVF